ncbi:MAG: hypothetical protein LBG50_00030, partial [Clostridiales Family XIII bacterium]|nr:hypothetical protein [Clostridiales Family XIII bacterium]
MKSTRKQIAFVICVVLVALAALPLGACDDKNAGGTGRVKPADGGEVLAVAGGQDITQKQVDALCAFATAAQGSSLDTLTDAKKQELSNQMLVFAADNVLIKNAAEKADKTVAENAAAEIEQQYEQFLIQTPTVAEQVSSGALSAGTVKDYLAAQYYYYAFSEQVAKDQPPSEGAIQQVYEQYQDQFVTPESISLRHILIMNP